MFNSPNTAAMMGTVPTERRGIAAGARTMLQNTGAILSIAFVLAIITAAVPTNVLFKIFSGLASGLTSAQLDPFITNMHTALWILAGISVVGAGVSMLRPSETKAKARPGAGPPRPGTTAAGPTPRPTRYYEDIGLLPAADDREPGSHRTYSQSDVDRLIEVMRLRTLL